jgi:hypothetical protein
VGNADAPLGAGARRGLRAVRQRRPLVAHRAALGHQRCLPRPPLRLLSSPFRSRSPFSRALRHLRSPHAPMPLSSPLGRGGVWKVGGGWDGGSREGEILLFLITSLLVCAAGRLRWRSWRGGVVVIMGEGRGEGCGARERVERNTVRRQGTGAWYRTRTTPPPSTDSARPSLAGPTKAPWHSRIRVFPCAGPAEVGRRRWRDRPGPARIDTDRIWTARIDTARIWTRIWTSTLAGAVAAARFVFGCGPPSASKPC